MSNKKPNSNATITKKMRIAINLLSERSCRESHPDGEFDSAGRWYPSDDEWRSCCANIRTPSRAFPHSLNTHCRGILHIARLYEIEPSDLRRAGRYLQNLAELQGKSVEEVARTKWRFRLTKELLKDAKINPDKVYFQICALSVIYPEKYSEPVQLRPKRQKQKTTKQNKKQASKELDLTDYITDCINDLL